MKLRGCKIRGVRANMVQSKVAITITTSMDDQLLDALATLRTWVNDDAFVDLELREQQMRLPFQEARPASTVQEEDVGEPRPYMRGGGELGIDRARDVLEALEG